VHFLLECVGLWCVFWSGVVGILVWVLTWVSILFLVGQYFDEIMVKLNYSPLSVFV